MNLRAYFPDRNSIATRLGGWFLLIALVPCVFLLAVTAYFSRRSLESTVRDRLTVICDAKAAQLEEFMAERKSDARFLLNSPAFTEAIVQLGPLVKEGKRDSDEYRRRVEAYRPRLAAFTEAKSYANFHLFNVEGEPLISHR